jgi:hypothetical protein
MQKEDEAENTRKKLFGRPYYDNHNGTGLCTHCNSIWKLEEQIMYTSNNKKRTYGTCPKCRIKFPLRKTPRTRDAWLERFPVKRIE